MAFRTINVENKETEDAHIFMYYAIIYYVIIKHTT